MAAVQFVGVVCGLRAEASAISTAAPGSEIRVAVSGANSIRAEALAFGFCREGAAAILSVGISGGLAPDLAPGDLLLGDVVCTEGGEEFPASETLLAALGLEADALLMRRAALLGANALIASPQAKATLFARYGASAVDLESHGAARAARSAGVPFAAIRAIADPAHRALPAAALNAVAPDGSTRVAAVLMECARAPGQFPGLIQLGADSNAALRTLRCSLGALFGRLLLSLDL